MSVFGRHRRTESVSSGEPEENTFVVDVWEPWRWLASCRIGRWSHPSSFYTPLWGYQNLQWAWRYCHRWHFFHKLQSSRYIPFQNTCSYFLLIIWDRIFSIPTLDLFTILAVLKINYPVSNTFQKYLGSITTLTLNVKLNGLSHQLCIQLSSCFFISSRAWRIL